MHREHLALSPQAAERKGTGSPYSLCLSCNSHSVNMARQPEQHPKIFPLDLLQGVQLAWLCLICSSPPEAAQVFPSPR